MKKQKRLVTETEDTVVFQCQCGCQMVQILDLELDLENPDENLYAVEFFHNGGYGPKSKKDKKLLNDVTLTGKQIDDLIVALQDLRNKE